MEAIILTHPDEDHHGGINRLLARYTVKCPIVTTSASYVSRPATRITFQNPPELELYFPKAEKTVYEISRSSADQLAGTPPKIEKNHPQQYNCNESSVLCKVGKFAAFTGDSTGKLIHQHLQFNERLIVFQVPHHGSKENSKLDMRTVRNHPMRQVLEPIRRHKAYEQALFYCTINAEVYLISHGKHMQRVQPST